MKSKKLMIGMAGVVLAVAGATAAYAASTNNVSYQQEISEVSKESDGVLSFDSVDKNNLPDGVSYADEISEDVSGSEVFHLGNE